MSMNLVVLEGRITRDPELKTTSSGIEYVNFSIATDEFAGKDKDKKTEFHDVTAWRRTAVFIANYFHKGDGILVKGKLHRETYEDKESGKNRSAVKVVADEVVFPSGKKSGNSEQPAASNSFEELPDDGNLPF